jgi:hypothetical protein
MKRLLSFLIIALALNASAVQGLKEFIGKQYGRDGLKELKQEAGYASVKHGLVRYGIYRGKSGDAEVLWVERTDRVDEKGRGILFTITDIREAPALQKDQVYGRFCKRKKGGRIPGTVGIVQVGNPRDPSEAVSRTVKIYAVDKGGHITGMGRRVTCSFGLTIG